MTDGAVVDHRFALVVLLLTILVLGVASRRAVALGGLAAADFLIRRNEELGRTEMAAALRRSGVRLSGAMVGVSTVALTTGLLLATQPAPADRLVVALAGCALALRSRLFARTVGGFVMLVVGALLAVTGVTALVLARPTDSWWAAPLAAFVVSSVVLAPTQMGARHGAPAARRLLRWAEATVVTTLMCAAVLAMGFADLAVLVLATSPVDSLIEVARR